MTISTEANSWDVDTKDLEYVSKEYVVEANKSFETYSVEISRKSGDGIEGIKLTDTNNQEKTEFESGETFKVMIPIKDMKEADYININVKAQIKTMPIYFGAPTDTSKQSYVLRSPMLEDGEANLSDRYSKNSTKITIKKYESENKTALEGVKFALLNENREIIESGLTTDKDGKIVIENLLPGKYYVREIETLEGYSLYEDDIAVELVLNEESSVTVYNQKSELIVDENKDEVITSEQEATSTVIRLPVAGM